jgi:hypothetical protein
MRTVTEVLYAIAITLWVGGLWTVGFVVAPVLFATLPERAVAGALAGKLFGLMAYIAIVCAVYLLLFRLGRFGGSSFRQAVFWIIVLMLGLAVAGEFGVQPILAGLKHQALTKEVAESVLRDRFAAWHGIASVLFVIESVLGAVLVWLHARSR